MLGCQYIKSAIETRKKRSTSSRGKESEQATPTTATEKVPDTSCVPFAAPKKRDAISSYGLSSTVGRDGPTARVVWLILPFGLRVSLTAFGRLLGNAESSRPGLFKSCLR